MLKDPQTITLECVFGFMRSDSFSLEDMISSVSLNTGDTRSQLLALSKRTNTPLDQFRSVTHEAFHAGFCVLFHPLSPFSEECHQEKACWNCTCEMPSLPFKTTSRISATSRTTRTSALMLETDLVFRCLVSGL